MIRAMVFAFGAIVSSLAMAEPITAPDGKAVWTKSCAGCHAIMAPKAGDKAAWAPFVKQGAAEVAEIVLKGKGAMPPKGGTATEAEARAAVEYILGAMQ
jgi:cytochrome c5